MRDLPFSIFKDVNERVTSLNLASINSHCKFIYSSILSPVGSNDDVTLENFSLWHFLKESIKVISDQILVGTRKIADGWQKHSILGISGSNFARVKSCKSTIP